MFSYLPLRTYVLSLLIIGSIFSLKGQEKEQEAPEEQPIKRYKGFKLEFAAPFNRFALYQGFELGLGIAYLAPQYYIHNNISVGLQYEYAVVVDDLHFDEFHTYMATGDYYFTNGAIRPALGLGLGLTSYKDNETITALALSPRFKLHLDWFILHLSYDINIHEEVPNSFRFGIAFTLFGKKK